MSWSATLCVVSNIVVFALSRTVTVIAATSLSGICLTTPGEPEG